MRAKDYRAKAREALRGKWLRTALILLLAVVLGGSVGVVGPNLNLNYNTGEQQAGYTVQTETTAPTAEEMAMIAMILGVVALVMLAVIAYSLFLGAYVRIGLVQMGCKVLDGETPRVSMLFPYGVYWKSVGLCFMKGLFIGLWSMLLVFPGFIAAYRYAMADYILYNNPEIGVMGALRESKEQMQGRKWRLFCLDLSFTGWVILAGIPSVLTGIVTGVAQTPAAGAVMLILGVLGAMVAGSFLNAYIHLAQMAFFRDVHRAAQWQDEARQGEEYAEAAYNAENFARYAEPATPFLGQTNPVEPALNADETVAKDMFLDYKCSRRRMQDAGVLEEYNALNASPISQERWKRDYGDMLMRRFDQDAAALDDILNLIAEYALAELCDRALSRIERHFRQETLPDAEILNMAGRMLALITSGVFADDDGFVNRKKQQISGMADRLEHRLKETDPEGEWNKALGLIRQMCG